MQLVAHACIAAVGCLCGIHQAIYASATLHFAHVALDERQQVRLLTANFAPCQCTVEMACIFCRDALAVLRRQYVFEASPRKQDHKHHDLTATDAPALEQVSDP